MCQAFTSSCKLTSSEHFLRDIHWGKGKLQLNLLPMGTVSVDIK